ncbi:MAG TPA: type II toxin-antitoxin system HicB family antitoxin [Solirubrobacteraceae bacterium]
MTPNNPDDYLIVIESGPNNYGAYAPDVPGCVATGRTVEECEREMREALVFHFEGLREFGEPIPEPTIAAAAFVPAA